MREKYLIKVSYWIVREKSLYAEIDLSLLLEKNKYNIIRYTLYILECKNVRIVCFHLKIEINPDVNFDILTSGYNWVYGTFVQYILSWNLPF